MVDLSYYIKVSSSPSGCNSYDAEQFKCDRYLDCDSCLEDKIIEHDKHIIEQYKENIKLKDTIRNIHDSVSIQMYCKGIDDLCKAITNATMYDECGNVINVLEIAWKLKKNSKQLKKGVKYEV